MQEILFNGSIVYSLNRNKYYFPIDSFMVNDFSFKGVPCLVKACRTARLIDINKYISSANVSAGCEHGLADSGKHQKSEIHKSQMSICSSKLKGLLNKQLDEDKLNGM